VAIERAHRTMLEGLRRRDLHRDQRDRGTPDGERRGGQHEEPVDPGFGRGAATAESPIGRYAACLASLVLERWEDARVLADGLRLDASFPHDVGDALAFIAAHDPLGYVEAVESVLGSFETREAYLEDIPLADTVLVLQALAARRDIAAELDSPLLPD